VTTAAFAPHGPWMNYCAIGENDQGHARMPEIRVDRVFTA